MEIEIKVDDSCKEPKIIVITNQVTEEINNLVKRISQVAPQMIVGFREDGAEIVEQEKISRVYAEDGKVVAIADGHEYILRLRLYELEERLNKNYFVRISNSEIINLKKVKNFDLSLTGTICVKFDDGTVTYVSRRFVSKIKQMLGI
ncbi:LytTR family DNA-binding domain-containing protein [Caproicibacterium sp. NSD3]